MREKHRVVSYWPPAAVATAIDRCIDRRSGAKRMDSRYCSIL